MLTEPTYRGMLKSLFEAWKRRSRCVVGGGRYVAYASQTLSRAYEGDWGKNRMTNRVLARFALTLLGVVLLAWPQALAQGSAAGNEPSYVSAISQQYVARWNAGDAAGVADLYADDAVLVPPTGSLVQGRAAILQVVKALRNQGAVKLSVTFEQARSFGQFTAARFKFTFTDGSGNQLLAGYSVLLYGNSSGRLEIERQMAVASAASQKGQMQQMQQQAQGSAAAVPAVIAALVDQFQRSYNSGDAAGTAGLFTKDGLYYASDGSSFDGRQAIQQAAQQFMDLGATRLSLSLSAAQVAGDSAFDKGDYMLMDAAGSPVDAGHFTTVLEKSDGAWQIRWLTDVSNSAMQQVRRRQLQVQSGAGQLATGRPVSALLTRYLERFNAGDAAGVADLWRDDGVYYADDGSVNQGKQAIQQKEQSYMDQGVVMLSAALAETRVVGDLAFGRGTFTATDANGQTVDVAHFDALFQENSAGSWRVAWVLGVTTQAMQRLRAQQLMMSQGGGG